MILGFRHHAQSAPHREAVILDDRAVTYGELHRTVNRLANGLAAQGIGFERKVAFLLYNGLEFFTVSLACATLQAIAVPINYHFKTSEIAHILQDSDAEFLVVDQRLVAMVLPLLDRLPLLPPERILVVGGPVPAGLTDYHSFVAAQSDGEPDPEVDGMGGGTMIYTSGTTGMPKGVYRPNEAALMESRIRRFVALYGFSSSDVHLMTSPNYHSAPNVYARAQLLIGATVVVMRRFDAEECLQLIERYRVTTTHMVPTQFHRILGLPAAVRNRYDISSLRAVIHAGAPCPVHIKYGIMDFFGRDKVYEYWGATEVTGTAISPQEWLRKPGSVGKANPGTVIQIVDDDGNALGPGEIGEIWVKAPHTQFSYYKDPHKTETAVRPGGFITVGDMGYLDADGYLYIVDRRNDMIISGGVNVYPAEIEAVLLQHAAVADAAVIGVPDDEWGEAMVAFVVLRPGVEATPEELQAHCAAHLANYKVPRTWRLVSELPRDASGKLFRRRLRDPYWVGRERQV